ncbi:MAG: low molecular weight phosphotyrosine protein phosphatase [Synergistaceae bacterium]|nr:low molecular weight phosphotyrosine protein phosphatase [Synergistaceae bacterium]
MSKVSANNVNCKPVIYFDWRISMIRILFVCHGNICRSPMAEFIMKHLVREAGCQDKFFISSAAATSEEIGNDMYPNAKSELKRHGIKFTRHEARKLTRSEANDWDVIIAMDNENLYDIAYILGSESESKVKLLMSFTGENREVSDPWYTRNFERAYDDIYRGCEALLKFYA